MRTDMVTGAMVKVALPAAAMAGALIGLGVAVRSNSSSGRSSQAKSAAAAYIPPSELMGLPHPERMASKSTEGVLVLERERLAKVQHLMSLARTGQAAAPLIQSAGAGRVSGDIDVINPNRRQRSGVLLGRTRYATYVCNQYQSCDSGPNQGTFCPDTAWCNPGSSAQAPTINSVTGPANGYYRASQNLDFSIAFSSSVTVTGTPRLALSVGGTNNAYANYVTGSPGSTLTFRYVPSSGDNGSVSDTSPLDLNSGTIQDGSSQSATLTFNSSTFSGVVIDTVPPDKSGANSVSANDVDSSGSYSNGDTLTLNFSEPVATSNLTISNIVVSGGHDLGGGATLTAQSASGGYASSYLLTLGSLPSLLAADTLSFASANVLDRAGNQSAGTISFSAPILNSAPYATSITVSGSATVGGQLTGGYTYNDADGDLQNVSGSGTSFRWLRSTDNSVATTGDNSNVAAGFTLGGNQTYTLVAADGGKYLFYCVTPKASAGISTGGEMCSNATSQVTLPAAPGISTVGGPASSYYKAGQSLTVTLNFGSAVTVSGTPRIVMTIGGATVFANYVSGSGTSALTFSYSVQAGDTASSGISITSPVDLNGGTILDIYTQAATLNFTPPTLSGVIVDTTAPDKASSGSITANDVDVTGSYTAGDTLTLTFSEPVATANVNATTLAVSGKVLGTGASVSAQSSSNGYATVFTLTLGTGTNLAGGDVLSIAGGNVLDRANNAASTAVSFSVPNLNAAPVASNVGMTGSVQVGAQLTGSYTYTDHENDPQGTSLFAWYSGASSNGTGRVAIAQATGINYTPVVGDVGKYLFFCVTPVASAGTSSGAQVCSSASAAVLPAPINGQCATVSATAFMPLSGLCATPGAASVVNVGSPWTWTCQGSYGGATSGICSAPNSAVTGSTTGRATQSVSNGWSIDTSNSAGFIPLVGHAKSPQVAPPQGYSFPEGLFDVTLTGGGQGSSTSLLLTFSTPLPAGTVYMKYGKTSPSDSAHWYQFSAAQIGTYTITLPLTDGGAGDDDGITNGVITDPGGPAIGLADATSVPTLSEWAISLLSSGVAILGVLGGRLKRARGDKLSGAGCDTARK